MDTGRITNTFTSLRVIAALVVLAAMCGSMRQQAQAQRQGAPAAAAVLPSDFTVMPPALRARVLSEIKAEYDLSHSAYARDCYNALAAQDGGGRL